MLLASVHEIQAIQRLITLGESAIRVVNGLCSLLFPMLQSMPACAVFYVEELMALCLFAPTRADSAAPRSSVSLGEAQLYVLHLISLAHQKSLLSQFV